jgi:adenylate cyclase
VRAAQAAREMQEDIGAMRRELEARGLPPIFMRIGIHTCPAIVGNLGAADRFNYTAVGDGVNLASRLEGVNKLFGTEILMSAETARGAGGEIALRRVGRVIVKGKTEPVDILTPESDEAIRLATARALDAYAQRNWDSAEAAWREVLARRPLDGVARHYLDRIAAWREHPPPQGWDGGEALDKL